MMKAPLIVIGAQKCGTATLTQDLACCDQLWVDPTLKEDSPLLSLSADHKNDQKVIDWFNKAESGKIPVNISTRYSMNPKTTVDIERVATLLPHCRILYVMRNPLERTLSHHHHDRVLGITSMDAKAENEIKKESAYVSNSLYGKQLRTWIKFFPEHQIKLVKFESYISNRRETMNEICQFLGVANDGVDSIDEQAILNVTASRYKFNPLLAKFLRSSFYQNTFKKLLGSSIRALLKVSLAGKNESVRSEISPALTQELMEVFEKDHALLSELHSEAPSWD